jgi:short-subunit dehydrogenase
LLLDVTSPDQVSAAYQRVQKICGEGGLTALINNAGHNYNSAFEYSDEGLARSMMEVNFFGVVRTSQTFIPLLRLHAQASRRNSKLINVGSIGSLIGLPWESFYHASKFAVLGLTESLRHELYGQGIRATAVLPGGIKTEFARKTSASVTVAMAGMDDIGHSLYGKGLRRISDMVAMVDRWGSSPDIVARRIGRIVRAANPGLKYVVGTDARLMQAMAGLLPSRVLHSLLRPTFGA